MRRRRIYAGLIVFLFFAVLILLWRRSDQVSSRKVLPDGSKISLSALTFGTNHSVVAGNFFQRMIGPRLPAYLKARFKIREMRVTPDPNLRNTDVLVAWVEVQP